MASAKPLTPSANIRSLGTSGLKCKQRAEQTGQAGYQDWYKFVATPRNAVAFRHFFYHTAGFLLGNARFFTIQFNGMARTALF